MIKVGNKIRQARKNIGFNMKEFAARVGISYLTLYRVETDKVSPSVALLSEIAHHLGEPLSSLLDEEKNVTIIKKKTATRVASEKMNLQLLLPKGIISENVSVSFGKCGPGEFVSSHSHEGYELTYILKGKAVFNYDGKQYEVEQGDLMYFKASVKHSAKALEDHEFLSVYFRK